MNRMSSDGRMGCEVGGANAIAPDCGEGRGKGGGRKRGTGVARVKKVNVTKILLKNFNKILQIITFQF